ncbi:MAG: SUMF1/EgtB/PvdO family nonheme iron enzyme [Chlamydiia bacterium]|nr:SUMF1/EgtB/PvdO family nonheme iron enzyme [Chlamydiia bacterium]
MQQQVLGDYNVIKTLGQGSLGMCVLAEHRFIKKPYVLKILPEELAHDRNFVTRFEEEVIRLASLEHPHIVKIHTVSYAEGVFFLVTDCVVDSLGESTNLGQYMAGRKEPLREEELVSVLSQIAAALDYAHAKFGENDPILHRSLKLSNILLGKGRPGIEVLISDFGLSKIVGSAVWCARSFKAVADTLLQQAPYDHEKTPYLAVPIDTAKVSKLTLSFLQNFAFLAPEQKRGRGPTAETVETDTYAFGVLTYYLIAGEFPEGVFPPPSKLRPDYQLNWDFFIRDCLHREKTDRPQKLLPLIEKLDEKGLRKIEVEREVPKSMPFSTPKPPLVFNESELVMVAPEPSPAALLTVEPKSAVLAMTVPTNPLKNELYEQKLSQMISREPRVTEYHPETNERREITPLLTEMVTIPSGCYERGSNEGSRDESPRHKITVDSFAIDLHPVSNEQFVRFLEFMGGEKDAQYNDIIRLKESRIKRSGGKLSIESGYAKHPVVGVTWYGAVAYAKWVGKRLPTEAEWEIACRGGREQTPFPTGQGIEKSAANFFSSDTTPVKSYAPNGYGLYDMVGNVYEWCQDWYGYNYYETSAQEPNNPMGPLQGVYRVLRGGCWKSLREDLRISHRHRNNPGTMNGTYGFRCAADVNQ